MTPITVVITRHLPSTFPMNAFTGRAAFELATTDKELRSAVRTADVLYSWQVPANVPAETPELHWIQLPSAGADQLHDLPVWKSDITITSGKGAHTVPLTEHVFAMLLGLVRDIPAVVRAQERSEWLTSHSLHPGEVRGLTMGIVGRGKIGDGIAHVADALGMRVLGTRHSVNAPRQIPRSTTAFTNPPWLEPEDLGPDIVFPASDLHDVLGESDVVVVILPLTRDTLGSFGAPEFAAMKHGAVFINIGRGPVVDETALVDALQSGRLGAAGLDVFEREPLPKSSPLWHMKNVIVSPHIGGTSGRTAERAAGLFAVNLGRYLDGLPLFNVVDRDQGY